jgi:putative ABC transport system permease protein
MYFNKTYLDEGYAPAKGAEGIFAVLVDTPDNVPRVAKTIDEEFRNSTRPTKAETEKAFQLDFVQMLGNVKAFLLSISLAVVFAILLVSANTMAMSIRERTREVALLKTLGFTRRSILGLFVGEAVSLSVMGGLLGSLVAFLVVAGLQKQGGFMTGLAVTPVTIAVSLAVAALVGFLSALVPSYHASQIDIVEGLRHIG